MNILKTVTKRIEGFFKSLQSQLIAKLSKVKRLPNIIAKGIKDIVRKLFKTLIKKPESLNDYKKLGSIYISKRALFFMGALLCVVIVLVYWFVVPFFQNLILGDKIVINSTKYHEADGSVSVYSENNTLIYEGDMVEGRITGTGKLYAQENLIYEGNFENEMYNGRGCLYKDNELIYEGDFVNNIYEGKGQEYIEGELIYDGEYKNGQYNGEGKKYTGGRLIYEGSFKDGIYEGMGKEYADNKLLYEGNFVSGLYEGTGKKYEGDKLLYEGGFLAGVYQGNGTKYVDGRIKYKGEFKEGLPDGQCIIYGEKDTAVFNGTVSRGEINYYSYLSCTTSELSTVFPSTLQKFDLYGKPLYVYTALSLGFIEGEDTKTDRFIFYGDQELYGFSTKRDIESIKKDMPENYFTEYEYMITPAERSLAGYIGRNVSADTEIYCVKYIIGDIFIKGYAVAGDSCFLYYETGSL